MICQLWDKSEAIDSGLPCNENHLVYSWGGTVFFSASMKGNGLSCHVASKRAARKNLRVAVKQFCQYMFFTYTWCDVIIAHIDSGKKSVINLVKNCGFSKAGETNLGEVYILCRS